MDHIRGSVRGPAPAVHAGTPAPAPAQPHTGPTQFHPAPPSSRTDKRRSKKAIIAAGIVIALVLAALAMVFLLRGAGAAGIDSSKYQAVFFTNGQVYFGKLQPLNGDYMRLTKVFYLQAKSSGTAGGDSKNPQEAAAATTQDIQLIKLGDEVHGPQDEMIIAKGQVLFYENLKPEGKVTSSINQYLNKK